MGQVPVWSSATTEPAARTIRERVAFLRHAILRWGDEYLKHIFQRRRPLPSYRTGHTGVYRLPNDVLIAIATGEREPRVRIKSQIRLSWWNRTSLFIWAMYYSGTEEEYRTYFMAPGCWPRGKLNQGGTDAASGTYVLNANHEMYSGGRGYFDVALPGLQQETSYFCLENDYWRIVAVDTGYHCTRGLEEGSFLHLWRQDEARLREPYLARTRGLPRSGRP